MLLVGFERESVWKKCVKQGYSKKCQKRRKE